MIVFKQIIPMSPMMYSNYPMQGMSTGQMQPMGMNQQNWVTVYLFRNFITATLAVLLKKLM